MRFMYTCTSRYLLLEKFTRMPLETVLAGAHWMGLTELDLDGLECIVCNLIYKGLIKGYLSHEKRMLVLSKDNAFPPVAAVIEQHGLVM